MIQELFGGSNVGIIGGERSKLSTPTCGGGGGGGGGGSSFLDHVSPSVSPSSTSAAATATAAAPAGNAATSENNLRCPRCDSSNTKFCYYNNYNLTQPRHFCKTCRRYWTKGGTLRNVPIGGGCRKNKNTTITAAVSKPGAASKFKTVSSEMGKTGLFGGFEQAETLSSNPIIWASSQNSHFLSLIRGTQTPNPNHLTNSFSMKEEVSLFGSSHLSSDSAIPNVSRAFGPDHLGPTHLPPLGLYRNQTLSSHGILHGEAQNHGLQEVYHRLRATSNCYPDHAPVILGNMASANSSASAAILESAPVAAGEMGFWNPTISWPTDLPTTNGAYP